MLEPVDDQKPGSGLEGMEAKAAQGDQAPVVNGPTWALKD